MTSQTIPDYECLDTDQVSPGDPSGPGAGAGKAGPGASALLGYFFVGVFLGVLFIMSEVASWYRIQEMFRFQSFHMYGIIGSAVAVAAISVQVIRRLDLRTLGGQPIRLSPKEWGSSRVRGARYWIGGTLFGLGWALIGACPGPMFALVGGGLSVMILGLLSAMAGTWAYAALRSHLPH
ncbi:YeeE/YedE thiosulfate transporter family protein [soil metagenome]